MYMHKLIIILLLFFGVSYATENPDTYEKLYKKSTNDNDSNNPTSEKLRKLGEKTKEDNKNEDDKREREDDKNEEDTTLLKSWYLWVGIILLIACIVGCLIAKRD